MRVVERWEVELVIEFFQELADKYQKFEENILSECLSFCSSALLISQHQNLIIKFLAELCLHFEPPPYTLEGSSSTSTNFALDFHLLSLKETCLSESDGGTVASVLIDRVGSWRDCLQEEDGEMEDSAGVEGLWVCVLILRHMR